jgi:Putative O-methyltransferase
MASFNAINYSLRPSKSIERHIVFDCIRVLQNGVDLRNMLYLGFGSVWFTDFMLAHKYLDIDEMISIEAHEIGFKRAQFNAPFSSVTVKEGQSSIILPELFDDDELLDKPWLIWLDYDYELREDIRDDLRLIVERAPANSMLLATFNGHERSYGRPADRVDRLSQILGNVVPDDLEKTACKGDRMLETLGNLSINYLRSVAAEVSRPGGFIPAFNLPYQDGSPMITIGGVLPSVEDAQQLTDLIEHDTWNGFMTKPIRAPHLTMKEAVFLQSKLPKDEPLSRGYIQSLGLDLEDEELEAFQAYYKHYPAFAQVIV